MTKNAEKIWDELEAKLKALQNTVLQARAELLGRETAPGPTGGRKKVALSGAAKERLRQNVRKNQAVS